MRVPGLLAGRADLLLGAGFAVAWLGEALVRDGGQPERLALDLCGVLLFSLLALRRRRPVLVVTVLALGSTGSTVVGWALGIPSTNVVVPILALIVASYSLGAYAARPVQLLAGVSVVLPVVASDLAPGTAGSGNSLVSAVAFFAVFVGALPALAGRLVRGRASLVGRLREQESLLIGQRAAATEAALAEERVRLAGRLDEALLAGMSGLAADAQRAGDPANPGRRAVVAGIEERARELLAQTRSVVVSLAADGTDQEDARPVDAAAVPPVGSRARAPRTEPAGLAWSALAAAALAIGLVLQVRQTPVRVPEPLALAACLALAAPLAAVWRRPVPATAAVQAAAVAFSAVVVPLPGLFAWIGLALLTPFFVAAFAGRRGAVAGLLICCAGQFLVVGASELPGELPLLVLSWVAGLVLAERGRLVARLQKNTEALIAGRPAALRSAVLRERERVARDLHDSVGHRLTVLALHASAARRMWDTDRSRAEAAVATVARVAREALAELEQGHADDGVPAPDLAAVPELVAGARAAGVPVRLELTGPITAVPAGTQLTAYRVVQEALTNVLRHAPGAPVAAEVRFAGDHLVVDVANAAPLPLPADGERAPLAGSGSGLRGMRSRVEACGGRLDWGARPDGGFCVRAEFPLAVVPA